VNPGPAGHLVSRRDHYRLESGREPMTTRTLSRTPGDHSRRVDTHGAYPTLAAKHGGRNGAGLPTPLVDEPPPLDWLAEERIPPGLL
jgi:hypothetical protein